MLDILYDLLLMLFAALPWAVPLFFWPNCPCCGSPCGTSDPACQSGYNPPASVTVVFVGIDGTANCPATGDVCADLNGTYVVPSLTESTAFCRWHYAMSFCDGVIGTGPYITSLYVFLQSIAGAPRQTKVRVQYSGINGEMEWTSATFGNAPVDCNSISSPVSCPPSFDGIACNNAASTCDVTF